MSSDCIVRAALMEKILAGKAVDEAIRYSWAGNETKLIPSLVPSPPLQFILKAVKNIPRFKLLWQ